MEEYLLKHSEFVELSAKVLTCITVVISCICAIRQWFDNSRLKRAEYLEKLIERFRTDKELVEVKYRVARKQWFNPDFFKGKQLEQQVDRLLTYLCYFSYLKEEKIIKTNEFDFFRYTIDSFLYNPQIQDYLRYLYHRSQIVNGKVDKIPLSFSSEPRVNIDGGQSTERRKTSNVSNNYRRPKRFPFQYLLDYGEKQGIIEDTFYEKYTGSPRIYFPFE